GRPDVGEQAATLASALRATPPPAEREALLHGDAHPKNCLLGDAGATLIDLDQAALGPASADIGGVLARLLRDLLAGRLDAAEAAARGESFLEGYARHRPLPPPESLAWH